jgi:hypothetical protein
MTLARLILSMSMVMMEMFRRAWVATYGNEE